MRYNPDSPAGKAVRCLRISSYILQLQFYKCIFRLYMNTKLERSFLQKVISAKRAQTHSISM
jgi:hypothetical protein